MADKRKPVKRGRITPKATAAKPQAATASSGRYTPPIPREVKVSPRWVPVLMGVLLVVGMVVIIANYLNLLPGPEASNWYLLAGLGLITAGFIVATRWR